MTFTTVLLLLVALIGLLIAVNAIEQYKQRLAAERHQLLLKLAAIISENDELLLNKVRLPISTTIQAMLLKRSISVINQVMSMVPDSQAMPARLQEAKEQLESLPKGGDGGKLIVPNNDAHNAALIKTIKKLRYILSKQKTKGTITQREFAREDSVLGFYLLRIFVEFKIHQAEDARDEGKLGSARQFYDKALKTLRGHTADENYTSAKEREILEQLMDIEEVLRNQVNEDPVGIDVEAPEDDLALLFSDTKRKWDME